MFFSDDGKFYLEPEIYGYNTYFKALDSTDAFLCLDPEGGPFFIFNITSKYGRDKGAILDAMIALIEASRTIPDFEKVTCQLFCFTSGYVYKCPNGSESKFAYYLPMEKKAPAKIELCMN